MFAQRRSEPRGESRDGILGQEHQDDAVRDVVPVSRARRLSRTLMGFTSPRSEVSGFTSPDLPTRRPSRLGLSRARSSLQTRLPGLFARSASERTGGLGQRPASSSRTPTESPLLPPVNVPPQLDLTFESPDTSQSTTQTPPVRQENHRATSSLSERIQNLRPDRSFRGIADSLRRRRPPFFSPHRNTQEDQAFLLSQLLSMAAATTAATLMGNDDRDPQEQTFAADGDDGSFDGFLQALRNGRIASELRQTPNGPGGSEGNLAISEHGPLNFFRMFRFGPSTNASTRSSRNDRPSRPLSSQENAEGEDGRLVPIIIVGIRSISGPADSQENTNTLPPFLEALSNFPTAELPNPRSTDTTIDSILSRSRGRGPSSRRRRASMGGFRGLGNGFDSQRDRRSPFRVRSSSGVAVPSSSESPPGPLPPPSTPATALSSGYVTPIEERPSTALTHTFTNPSTTSRASPDSRRVSFLDSDPNSLQPPTEEEPLLPRSQSTNNIRRSQRRNSDSAYSPRYGSGSSRRNGIVEPDHPPSEAGTRSWIIYVLGGSYPEGHPILTTPSLFTDSPTYEDMLLLSSLLGPAKPPVASDMDVAAAGGLLKVQRREYGDGQRQELVAVAVEGDDRAEIAEEQRCLVCLCEYEVGEEARKLVKCNHLFHRECIDEV